MMIRGIFKHRRKRIRLFWRFKNMPDWNTWNPLEIRSIPNYHKFSYHKYCRSISWVWKKPSVQTSKATTSKKNMHSRLTSWMKLFLQPSRYTAHRIACKSFPTLNIQYQNLIYSTGIALYRALLEQCPRVQHLAEGWPATPLTFKHLIRKQFQRNRHLQSPRLVVAALKAGYQV